MSASPLHLGPAVASWLKRALTLAIVVAVSAYIIREAREVDWGGVLEASRGYGVYALAIAVLLSVPSQLSNACLDLIGRHVTGHGIPVPRVMLISYTGYFYSLNLGALVGGLAFRYSLYARSALSALQIGQIIFLSILTNWSGYMLIGGIVLAYAPPALPAGWGPGTPILRGIGLLLLATTTAYLLLCAMRGGSRLRFRDNDLRVPTPRIAAVQLGLSITNWAGTGALLTWLIPGEIGWLEVMPVLMVSALAGIWSHVPGGLGVTEFVFVTMLGHRIEGSEILAAMLIFRVIYYLIPFLLSTVGYAYLQLSRTSS